jgi:hypothetical protein
MQSVKMTLSYIRRLDNGHEAAQLHFAVTVRAALRVSAGILYVDCDGAGCNLGFLYYFIPGSFNDTFNNSDYAYI